MNNFFKNKDDIEINDSLSLEQKILGFYLSRKNMPDFSLNVKKLFEDKEGYRIVLSNIIITISSFQNGVLLLKSFKNNENFSDNFKLHCHSLTFSFINLISPFLTDENIEIDELCNALMYHHVELINLVDDFELIICDIY